MLYEELAKKFKYSKIVRDLNYLKIPCNIIPINDEGMVLFNSIIEEIEKVDYYKQIVRTQSGGISIKKENFHPMYDIRSLKSCVEITLIDVYCFRFQFRLDFTQEEKEDISGRTAFSTFCKRLLEHGVDIKDYILYNGKEIKDLFPKPKCELLPNRDHRFYRHAHHIDIHSAYMSGIAEEFPEFYDTINDIYKARKKDPVNKGILTHTWGFLQSSIVQYKWAHLSLAGIRNTIKKLDDLTKRLLDNNNFILAYNTDGIWYVGDVYHGEGEGNQLGQWSNDHIDCTIYFNSIGCYGFIENGKTEIKARGKYALDKVKNRDEWVLDDLIYNLGESISYVYDIKAHRVRKKI